MKPQLKAASAPTEDSQAGGVSASSAPLTRSKYSKIVCARLQDE